MTSLHENQETKYPSVDPILKRIPIEWGRHIRCSEGWYPLIAELDANIAKIFPDYEIQQVKEKFGTLRYYWSAETPLPECCVSYRYSEGMDDHLLGTHADRVTHDQKEDDALMLTFETNTNKVEKLVHDAEFRSASICELCSAPGALNTANYYVRTLCASCSS